MTRCIEEMRTDLLPLILHLFVFLSNQNVDETAPGEDIRDPFVILSSCSIQMKARGDNRHHRHSRCTKINSETLVVKRRLLKIKGGIKKILFSYFSARHVVDTH